MYINPKQLNCYRTLSVWKFHWIPEHSAGFLGEKRRQELGELSTDTYIKRRPGRKKLDWQMFAIDNLLPFVPKLQNIQKILANTVTVLKKW